MSDINISVTAGKAVRLKTSGKYCYKDIVVNAPLYASLIVHGLATNDGSFEKENFRSITLKTGVIGANAFKDCSKLTSLTISNDVASIGEYAFNGCTSLTSITIPDSVTSIGGYAFGKCTSLRYVVIGNGVTSICAATFNGCTSLTSINIPDSVTSIGSSAFSGCERLRTVTIPINVTSIGGHVFIETSGVNINYLGTMEQWNAIDKDDNWTGGGSGIVVHCTDGDIQVT